ncbi:melanin-concentrating hormone receptor 1-like [Rhinatrema bivittatum]|uniref:melanin-concentrating hormone receptor 1-like n=1 Tax=Rhinatrema bivittatum TaxID=194408 RepID=UPI001126E841|nr:melanin-concentrating hormone receptor 1-like [Rhinatrema bivittatum]
MAVLELSSLSGQLQEQGPTASHPGELAAALLDRRQGFSMGRNLSRSPDSSLSNVSLSFCELDPLLSTPVDYDGPLVDEDFLGPTISLVLPVVYALICGCGVLANGLVISILLSCKQKLVSDIYILNLAVADLLFLVGMPFIIHQLIQEKGWIFGDFLCRAVTAIDLNNQFTSVAIITVLCIDRYVAVVYSATMGQKRTMRCTALINGAVWAGSLLLTTPAMLYARVQRDNQTEICLIDLPGPSSLYWYTLYQSILAFIVPVLIITVLYSLTLHHLFRVMRRVQKKKSARSKKVTRMALTIIAAFLICWTPFHVVQLVNLTATPSKSFFYLNQVTICLSYAHSCVSPVLVIFFTEFFRERIAHSRYCRFILRWRALRAGTALPTQELTSTICSPHLGIPSSQRRRRPFSTETPPCSVTESTRISVALNGQEENSFV